MLLPPDLREALPEGHPALLLGELVERLDLSEVWAGLPEAEVGGRPGFDPKMMVRVWLFAYATGVRSSRKLAQALIESVPLRVLANNQQPRYWALNRFRTRHREALGNLLVQTVTVAAEVGLVRLGSVALDGSKIKASASKHKAMSYARLKREEARLTREITAYLDACDEQDALEDEQLGRDDDGVSLPEALRDAQARREKIDSAMRELERRARDRAAGEQDKRRDVAARKGKSYQPRKDAAQAEPKDQDQINFTDPDSRIMLAGDGSVLQGFNAQLAVDTKSHVVLAASLSNRSPDAPHLPELVEQTIANAGRAPKRFLADAGYYSGDNVALVERLGCEALIPPDKIRHAAWRRQRAPTGRIPKNLSGKDRMRRRLATQHGKRRYLERQASVEPVFGATKQARGLRQFLHRGLDVNHHLFRFDMAAHNALKIIQRLASRLPTPSKPAVGRAVAAAAA